jgi:multiple sugar transport system permease protein
VALGGARWLVLLVALVVLNTPVIVTLVISFKPEAEISADPSMAVSHPTLANYAAIFGMVDRFDIMLYLRNSLAVSVGGTALALLLAVPAAYAIARLGLGRRWLLAPVATLRAIPLIIFSIPIYLMFQVAGLLDTRTGLALVLAVVNLPLTLVLAVGAIRELPVELDEAARMDGAGHLAILWRVVVPLLRPTLAAAAILGFVTAWNEFLFGLILTTRYAVPATVGASFFFAASGGGVHWGIAAATMTLCALPPMVLGLGAYRWLGRSMTTGAVKG